MLFQTAGAETIIDAVVTNTPIFVKTSTAQNTLAGSILLDNIVLNNVNTAAVQDGNGKTLLAGGSTTIRQWAQGEVLKR